MDKTMLLRRVAAVGIGVCAAMSGLVAAHASDSPSVLTVFGDDGRYLDLDRADGTVLDRGLYGRWKQPQVRIDGAMIADVHLVGGRWLCALLTLDPQGDENGEQHFQVAVLDRQTLKVLQAYDLPQPQGVLPHLVPDPSSQNRLLLIDQDGHRAQYLDIGEDGALAASGAPMSPDAPLSSQAYVDAQGRIVDRDSVYDARGRRIRQVQANAILDGTLQQKFADLTLVRGTTRHYNGTILSASAGGRMLFTVGWDDPHARRLQAGAIVYDIGSDHVVSSFFTGSPVDPVEDAAGPSAIHLSPDGNRILVEGYQWRQGGASGPTRERTGQLAIYDALSGGLVGTIALPSTGPVAGASRLLGFSADARLAYYWFDGALSVIDLGKAQRLSTAQLPADFAPVAVAAAP